MTLSAAPATHGVIVTETVSGRACKLLGPTGAQVNYWVSNGGGNQWSGWPSAAAGTYTVTAAGETTLTVQWDGTAYVPPAPADPWAGRCLPAGPLMPAGAFWRDDITAAPVQAGRGGVYAGTLLTSHDSATMAQLASGGATGAMIEPSWRAWETARGTWSTAMDTSVANQAAGYIAAGMKITVGLALHYAPAAWLDPTLSRFVDQDGNVSDATNLLSSAYARACAAEHIAHLIGVIGAANISTIRITGGGVGEILYPQGQTHQSAGYSYWCYSPELVTAGSPNLAAGVTPNPFPAYRMGKSDTTTLTGAQRATLGDWYVGLLIGEADWCMDQCTAAGYTGAYALVQPGLGVTPAGATTVATNGFPAGALFAVGCDGQQIVSQLAAGHNGPRLRLHCSSIADGSGSDSLPTAADLTVNPMAPPPGLSSFRWALILAHYYLADRLSGENPGLTAGSSPAFTAHYTDQTSTGLLARTIAMVTAAAALLTKDVGLDWAHDSAFSSTGLPRSAYLSAIAGIPGKVPFSADIVAELASQAARYNKGIAALNIWTYTCSVVVAPPGTPLVNVGQGSRAATGTAANLAAWQDARTGVPIPSWAVPSPGTDAELTIVQGTDLWAYWHAVQAADGSWTADWGGRLDLSTTPGYFPNGGGETATGLPLAAGCLGLRETQAAIAAGTGVDHALAVAVPYPAPWTRFSYPAQRSDGPSSSTTPLLEGQRLRLKATCDPTTLGLTDIGLVAARTALTRGLVVDDTASEVSLYAEWDGMIPGGAWGTMLAGAHSYDVLHGFPWDQLEAVAINYGKP